jgi:hypothetical protein
MNLFTDILDWLRLAKPNWKKEPKPISEPLNLSISDSVLLTRLIKEESEELIDGVLKNNIYEVIDGAIDLMWIIGNVFARYGFTDEQIDAFAKEVTESNFSKFCPDKQIAIETSKLYEKGEHPSKPGEIIQTYIKKLPVSNNLWVVLRSADDKIMKNYKYKPVNFTKIKKQLNI